ncbi:MAG: alpha/beta fold hydrolase [Bacteroidia bacterium]
MKIFQRLLGSVLCLVVFASISSGQNIVLTQSNKSGIYAKGENIRVSFSITEPGTDSVTVKIRKNYSLETTEKKISYSGPEVLLWDEICNEPTALIFEVKMGEEIASIGLVVDPDHFLPGTRRPKDMDSYWKIEKKSLKALPMEVKSVPVSDTEKGYLCSDIEINCTGPKPARGYFAKPETAKPQSLPIVLFVHAAGVKGSWCLSQPETALRYAKMGHGALAFDLNAHGMLNGQPQSYYDELESGELKNYYIAGVENKEDFYFRGMYLRLIRTLDFLTSQPEWDGKRIIVIGESQGGGQALAAAGLDKRVTAAVATVPAMCDWGGPFLNRAGGWPNPFKANGDSAKMRETLPYFDTAHLLKNSKATLVTEIGFIDRTCPSISIYAAINQSKGEKITFGVPYRGHHMDQPAYKETWENTVYKPKMAFIEDFLK